jgi:hypothetical protein
MRPCRTLQLPHSLQFYARSALYSGPTGQFGSGVAVGCTRKGIAIVKLSDPQPRL